MLRLNFLIAFFWLCNSHAQIPASAMAGGRSAGLAHSTVALTHSFSGMHNQAASALLENSVAAVSYQNRFFLNGLNLGHASFSLVNDWGTLGLNTTYFGGEFYAQSKFGLAYARRFGRYLSMGLQINYENSTVSEASNLHTATFEFGIVAIPVQKLHIGFHIYNPNRSFIDSESNQRLPTLGRLGFIYYFSNRALLAIETRSDLQSEPGYSGAFEYKIIEKLALRAGLAARGGLTASSGVGFEFGNLQANLAYEFGYMLGNNLVYSLQYQF